MNVLLEPNGEVRHASSLEFLGWYFKVADTTYFVPFGTAATEYGLTNKQR